MLIGIPVRVSKAETAYHDPYQERQDNDPEKLSHEQQWEQEQ